MLYIVEIEDHYIEVEEYLQIDSVWFADACWLVQWKKVGKGRNVDDHDEPQKP